MSTANLFLQAKFILRTIAGFKTNFVSSFRRYINFPCCKIHSIISLATASRINKTYTFNKQYKHFAPSRILAWADKFTPYHRTTSATHLIPACLILSSALANAKPNRGTLALSSTILYLDQSRAYRDSGSRLMRRAR